MYKRVVVGVSGGCDSMALLHTLHEQSIECIAVHVNYHKRPTALRDQQAVETLCRRLNVKLVIVDYDETKKGNFQKDARDFRYMTMVQVGYRFGCNALAVAHHRGDALETFIIQKRSGRISRIAGLKEHAKILNFALWRPLLNKTKEELIAYCKSTNITYYDDESNFSLDYVRNQIRQELSLLKKPQLEHLEQEMHLTQKHYDTHYDVVDHMLQNVTDTIPLEDYRTIEEPYRIDVLRQWIWNQGITHYGLSDKQLRDFDSKILGETLDEKIGYKCLCSSYGMIQIFEPISYDYTFDSIKEFNASYFKLSFTGTQIEGVSVTSHDFPITIRSPQKGDFIRMRFGSKNVNRFFIDRKISHNLRHCWPLVENVNKDVIFVSGMGCDIAHFSNNPSFFVVK